MASRADSRVDGGSADHARAMDAQYALQRHIYDLTRKYYLLGRDRLIRELAVPPGGSVLEVGVGTGRNLALVAKLYPDARLFGFDISSEMLKSAQVNMARVKAEERTLLGRADATGFDPQALFGEPGFDRVFISYSLSMIPEWQAALAQALSVVEPGGSLHIVDFGQQEGLPGWFRSGLRGWLTKFHVTPRADLFEVVERIAAEQGAVARRRSLYRGYAWEAVIKR
ncbi:class I SAM-dependent methyltransferase [Sphingobium nicotianae]|uniref:Methyltransferase domain-containing protein n=1 Tax=Sphingobium nicotianae TaxID=2782607 RepID=A0A9X1IRT5_9SPHN|nr:methyltransferase domain-containing protein [Sphingobium nicotianae]MBT2187692.1 methyltransferase domain-containing protein [Sphingobium nicotianae]